MRAKGYKAPKWLLNNKEYPYSWKNMKPELAEDAWMVDFYYSKNCNPEKIKIVPHFPHDQNIADQLSVLVNQANRQ